MGYRGVFASLSAAFVVSVGPIAPALATEPTDSTVGTYILAYSEKESPSKWVLSPCEGAAGNCVTVRQFELDDSQMTRAQWTGNAVWTVGSWTMTVDWPDVLSCPDNGPSFTRPVTFAWDATTGQGWRSFTDPGLCTDKKRDISIKTTLTKVSPTVPPAPAQAPSQVPSPATAPGPAAEPAPAPLGAAESMAPPPAAAEVMGPPPAA